MAHGQKINGASFVYLTFDNCLSFLFPIFPFGVAWVCGEGEEEGTTKTCAKGCFERETVNIEKAYTQKKKRDVCVLVAKSMTSQPYRCLRCSCKDIGQLNI